MMRAAGILLGMVLGAASVQATVPDRINYQGELYVGGSPYQGTANLKAVILDEDDATYWSNDGSSTNGSEPADYFPVTVVSGIFSVVLGDGINTQPMTADLFEGLGLGPKLRLWVDTGSGFEQLPDQPLASSLFALNADAAQRAAGDFTVEGELNLSPQGLRFDDGSTMTTAPAAPDTTWKTSGTALYYDQGRVGIGTSTPSADLHVEGTMGAHFSLLSYGSVDIGVRNFTNPAVTGFSPNGSRQDVVFTDDGMELIFSQDSLPGLLGSGLKVQTNNVIANGGLDVRGLAKARYMELWDGTPQKLPTIELHPWFNGGGKMWMTNDASNTTVLLTADMGGAGGYGRAGRFVLSDENGNTTFHLAGQAFSGMSQLRMSRTVGNLGIEMTGGASEIKCFDATGATTVWITGQDGGGEGRVQADVFVTTGGSDLSERFDIDGGAAVEPGTVVCIDPLHPGRLKPCDAPYQTTVAGIVSGARGVKPGMLMGQEGTLADGEHPVALSGRAWAWCDASERPIEPGNILTTSSTFGHAMAVEDPAQANGAVLGKAMTALDSGRGLVLVLVGLQ